MSGFRDSTTLCLLKPHADSTRVALRRTYSPLCRCTIHSAWFLAVSFIRLSDAPLRLRAASIRIALRHRIRRGSASGRASGPGIYCADFLVLPGHDRMRISLCCSAGQEPRNKWDADRHDRFADSISGHCRYLALIEIETLRHNVEFGFGGPWPIGIYYLIIRKMQTS